MYIIEIRRGGKRLRSLHEKSVAAKGNDVKISALHCGIPGIAEDLELR